MRSIDPAGWTSHGFFGRGAKTFGNPGGATSGTGYFVPPVPVPPNPGLKFTARASPTGGNPVFAMQSDTLGNTLLVDSTGRVFHSTDGGVNWGLVTSIASWDPVQPNGCLLVAAGTWVLSAQQNTGGVSFFRSINLGMVWAPIVSGIGAGGSFAMATDGAGNWFAIGNVIPAAPSNYGKSIDDGVTWVSAGVTTIAGTTAENPQLWDAGAAEWVVLTEDPVTVHAAIWTSPDALTWTENLASGPGGASPSYGGALISGGLIYTTDQASTDMFEGSTPATLAASDPVSENTITGGTFLVRAGIGGQFFVFDGQGNVANCTDYINWLKGTLNFSLGEFPNATCYDEIHNSVIAGGSAGSICTVP
jgi:hypothetical protein